MRGDRDRHTDKMYRVEKDSNLRRSADATILVIDWVISSLKNNWITVLYYKHISDLKQYLGNLKRSNELVGL